MIINTTTYNRDLFYTNFASLASYQISGGEFLNSAVDGLYIADNTAPGSALPYGDYGRICRIPLPFIAKEFEISFSTMITSTAVNRIGYIFIAFNGKYMQQGLTFYDADGQGSVYDHSTVYRVNTTILMSTGQVTTLKGIKVPEKCTYKNGTLTLEYNGSVVSTTTQTLEPIKEVTIYFGSAYNTTYPLPELHLYDLKVRKFS